MIPCRFCDEFKRGYIEFKEKKLGNCILFETENFLVFPAIGQIVEGYLLIAPKKHYLGMGSIPKELYVELELVVKKVRSVLTENYSVPLFFEHGPASQVQKGGCCIQHAHFHAVPVQMEIVEEISKHFKCNSIDSFLELKTQFKKEKSYFFVEDNNKKRFLFQVPNVVPSQYIRQIIAAKLNKRDRWNWQLCPGLDELNKTFKKLKDKF